jgi:AraC-like DNA-binding protein
MSAKEYIVRTRVRFAKLELKQMGKPLHQIAVDNGFYDQSVFTKFFRRIVGKTPLAYRRQHLSHGPFCQATENEFSIGKKGGSTFRDH